MDSVLLLTAVVSVINFGMCFYVAFIRPPFIMMVTDPRMIQEFQIDE